MPTLPLPKEPQLKDPKTFRYVGKPVKRLDSHAKVTGAAVFGLDVRRPDLLVAQVVHPPVFGGAVKSIDATRAKAVPGDAPSFVENTSDDGYTLGLGARTRLIEKLELEGTVKYANFSDYSDNTSFEFAGRWFFTDAFALGLEYTAGDEFDTFGAGVRYQFPAK